MKSLVDVEHLTVSIGRGPTAKRILRDSRRLQDDLVEQRVLAAGLSFNILGRDGVSRSSGLGLDAIACFGEALCRDDDGFDRLCGPAFDLCRSI